LVENVISLIFEGGSYVLDVVGSDTEYNVYTRAAYRKVTIYNDEAILHESLKKGGSLGAANELNSGMPGKIVKVMVKAGDLVKANQPILIMEAMKMENEMRSSHDTKVKEVLVKPGDSVESGQKLVLFEPLAKK
jgi:biotin carboxyl carrier protein